MPTIFFFIIPCSLISVFQQQKVKLFFELCFKCHISERWKKMCCGIVFLTFSCLICISGLCVSPGGVTMQPNGHIIYPQRTAALCMCVCVCSPMTETSYSIRNKASWLLCISMVKASACLSLFRGIPSMLRTRSPAFRVPSLEEKMVKIIKPYLCSVFTEAFKPRSGWTIKQWAFFLPGEMKDKQEKLCFDAELCLLQCFPVLSFCGRKCTVVLASGWAVPFLLWRYFYVSQPQFHAAPE